MSHIKLFDMENSDNSRRKFIKTSLGAGLLLTGTGMLPSCNIFRMATSKDNHYDSKGLPTVMLGKTGVHIPRIVMGLGSRYCHLENDDEALQMLHYSLDNGLFYWDTAWAYDNTIATPPGKKKGPRLIVSEERLGTVVNERRNEIFLSTKVTSRNPDEAMRQIETSMKRLQTDHFQMLMIHDVRNDADVDKICEKGNLLDILNRMKEQKVTRFIGFSGHTQAEAMKKLAERGNFDNMLLAMNHWESSKNPQNRQELAIPVAKQKGMGVMLMKVVRPKETIPGIEPKALIRYSLSLDGTDAIVLGMDSMEILKINLDMLMTFKPMNEEEMESMAMQLSPFYKHENLPWMKSGYIDGHWA
jgi:hypothetical protein